MLLLVLMLYTFFYGSNAGMGYLAVNEIKVEMEDMLESDQTIDSFGNYKFYDGQSATVTCHNTGSRAIFSWLSYKYAKVISDDQRPEYEEFSYLNSEEGSNKEWIIDFEIYGNESITTTKTTGVSKMYIKLKAEKDGSYIDCDLTNYLNTRSFITRIHFELSKTMPDIGFQVNGLILSPFSGSECTESLCFQYEYCEGENLTVQSLINEEDIECTTDTKLTSIPRNQKFQKLSSINFSTITKETHSTVSLQCIVKRKNEDLRILLRFVPNTIIKDFSPSIKGLSMANILLMYNNSTVKTISYEYQDNTTLSLKCLSDTSKPYWIFDGSEVEMENDAHEEENCIKSATFKLKPDKNSSVISCNSFQDEKKTEVLIRRKNKTIDNDKEVNRDPEGSEKKSYQNVIIGASIGTLVLLVIVVITIIKLTKRKLQLSNPDPTNIVYDNLQDQNEAAAPKQWNEVQYADPNDSIGNGVYAQPYKPTTVEKLYTRPVPKNKINGHPNQEDTAYAAIEELDPTYAQALPKSQRFGNGVQVLPSRNDLTYAELHMKTRRPSAEMIEKESPYAEVQKENPYVEIASSESAYAEPNCGVEAKSYENVFDSQKYVNTNPKDDYVAPAYCEVNKIKK